MKILITGGAGFIGSNLCQRLLNDGHFVICVDNLLTGSKENIAEFLENPNFTFVEKDVLDLELSDLDGVQAVYHLASPASPHPTSEKSYHKLAFETMRVNTDGTWKVCELATQIGAKVLFASTSETYGNPLQHPQKESYLGNVSTTGPRSVYDEAKRFGETIVSAFVRSKGLDGRIIRIFNTYGPRMALDDGRVVIEFVTKALHSQPLEIFGDGSQTRSFCYVEDLVDGIVRAMETVDTKGEVYNLGNPDEFKISELAEKVQNIVGSNIEVVYKDLPQDDPLQRCPDISKAKEKLGWEPKIGLDEGLERLIQYIRSKD